MNWTKYIQLSDSGLKFIIIFTLRIVTIIFQLAFSIHGFTLESDILLIYVPLITYFPAQQISVNLIYQKLEMLD